MHSDLVAGLASAGLVAGWLLDGLSAIITAPRRSPDSEAVPVVGGGPEGAPALQAGGPPDPIPSGPSAAAAGGSGPTAFAVVSGPWRLVPVGGGQWAERVAAALVSAVAGGLVAARLGPAPELAAYWVFLIGLVALSVVDLRVGLVPRLILYPTALLVVVGLVAASAVEDDWRALGDAGLAAVVAFLLFFALWRFYPGRALGFGDVRLAGVMGFALGWLGLPQAYLGFLAAFLLGAVYGIVFMAVKGTGRRTRVAFGPALAAGAAVGVLWGGSLAHAWLHHAG